MSNKFEKSFAPDNKLKKDKTALYHEVQQSILEQKEYKLGLKTMEKIEKFSENNNLSKEDVTIEFLERFSREEGALPDALGDEYIRLVYSLENIKNKMEEGATLYEIIPEMDKEIKAKKIFLNKDDVNIRIKELEEELKSGEAA